MLHKALLKLNKTACFPWYYVRMYAGEGKLRNRGAKSEAEYYYKLQQAKLKKLTELKGGRIDAKEYHEKMIKKIEKELERHKESLQKLKKLARISSTTGSGLTKGGMDRSLRKPRKMMSKIQKANEEEYFNRQQKQQLDLLEELLRRKINKKTYHEKTINELEKQINRHKEFLKKIRS